MTFNRLIYSSGFKVGTPSAEATATHITAEEFPLLAIVWAGVFAERTNESPSLNVLLIPVFSASVNSPLSWKWWINACWKDRY